MKTLDDVIEAMERCSIPHYFDCKGCPYEDDDAEVGCRSDDRDADALHYLKILKAKSEEPPIGEPPDYISLDFHRLAEMIGEPVYIKDSGCKGRWEIVMGVRKTADGEDVCFRGCNQWQRIGKTIYRTKEGADE